jgi:flagellar motor protein MotB
VLVWLVGHGLGDNEMSAHESVAKQTSSYRQGLVLGLTMAEVVLLIVFALLIALAAIWRVEHRAKVDLENKLAQAQAIGGISKPNSDDALLGKVRDQLLSSQRSKVEPLLKRVSEGKDVPILTEREEASVSEIRMQMQNKQAPEIDKHWRELVLASTVPNLTKKLEMAEAVEKVAPGSDTKMVTDLIEAGRRVQNQGEHDWPPIITLGEDQYKFPSGSAELSPTFKQQLKTDIVPELLTNIAKFRVDVVEVIGHTDEQPIALRTSNQTTAFQVPNQTSRTSNLDRLLPQAAKGSVPIKSLIPADNAGLGLSRAVSVVRELIADGRLPQPQYRILPLSGGQLIDTNETLTTGAPGDIPRRRRIEIRLRRSQENIARH